MLDGTKGTTHVGVEKSMAIPGQSDGETEGHRAFIWWSKLTCNAGDDNLYTKCIYIITWTTYKYIYMTSKYILI